MRARARFALSAFSVLSCRQGYRSSQYNTSSSCKKLLIAHTSDATIRSDIESPPTYVSCVIRHLTEHARGQRKAITRAEGGVRWKSTIRCSVDMRSDL